MSVSSASAAQRLEAQPQVQEMIQLNGVEKVYRTERIETVALSNINLSVRQGEFISIMGPSGSGKSTLLNVIGLLDVPTGGQVTLNQRAINSYSDRNLARVRNEVIGFIFQTFHLINDLSGNFYGSLRHQGRYRRIRLLPCRNVARPVVVIFGGQIVGSSVHFEPVTGCMPWQRPDIADGLAQYLVRQGPVMLQVLIQQEQAFLHGAQDVLGLLARGQHQLPLGRSNVWG